jgi:hypothetical protein
LFRRIGGEGEGILSCCIRRASPTKAPPLGQPKTHRTMAPLSETPNDVHALPDEGDDNVLNPEAEALLDRSTILLTEVESFQKSLRRANLERTVELRLFLNQVKSEHRCLQGVSKPLSPGLPGREDAI